MDKGIIYITTTSVNGLIKIGKTRSDQFETRMANLEQNGYWNVSGLHRYFAVEVDDYHEKEKLIHTMFSKSQVANSELFALDKKLAQELLEALGGKQIYPKLEKNKDAEPAPKQKVTETKSVVPDGVYYFRRKVRAWDNKEVLATMRVKDGKYYVLKGSTVCPVISKGNLSTVVEMRKTAIVENDILAKDYEAASPSAAGLLVLGGANDGWFSWKTPSGDPIDIFRKK